MQRRGFLQALMGVAAGLAGSAAVGRAIAPPPAVEPLVDIPLTTTPQVAITADTSKFERGLSETQATLVEMLKDCRVTSFEKIVHSTLPTEYRVCYRHAPNAPLSPLDAQAAEATAARAPISAEVRAMSNEIEIIDSGSFYGAYEFVPLERQEYEVEVRWI